MKIQVGERYKLHKKKIQPLLHTNNLRLDIYPFKFSQFQVFIIIKHTCNPPGHPYTEIFHTKGFTILNALVIRLLIKYYYKFFIVSNSFIISYLLPVIRTENNYQLVKCTY